MLKGILQNELFYCNHLGANPDDERDIQAFSARDERGEGLVIYLKDYAFREEINGQMRTYIVRDAETSEIVAYFALKAGLISINELVTEDETTFDTLPGVELANFAVNNAYIENYPSMKGVGYIVFTDFILPLIEMASETIGIKVLYIFSLPETGLIHRYEKYGFQRLSNKWEDAIHQRLKPNYDKDCIFMYLVF